jgi:hypothetical protein
VLVKYVNTEIVTEPLRTPIPGLSRIVAQHAVILRAWREAADQVVLSHRSLGSPPYVDAIIARAGILLRLDWADHLNGERSIRAF